MMMANYKIPGRFKRYADVFDCEVARARLCGSSSGSEHYSPDDDQSLTDLYDLVNSFLERECNNIDIIDEERRDQSHVDDEVDGGRICEKLSESEGGFSEARDVLQDLFGNQTDSVKRSIQEAVENNYSLPEMGSFSSPDFKRRLMSRLRRRGFDAGICKSKWEKSGHSPSGSYEYIDVLMSGGNRYIIEVCLAKEFEIAKPTNNYSALLKMFPHIFVCKKEELKQVTRLMCKSIKKSMKSAGLSVPPWRRLAYTQAKWFSPYKRTLNEFPKVDLNSPNSNHEELLITRKKRSIGFRPVPAVPFLCREPVFPGKMLVTQVGNLALAFSEKDDDVQ